MHLTAKQRRSLIIGLSLFLLGANLIQAIFRFNINRRLFDNLNYILMFIVIGLALTGRKPPKVPGSDRKS